MWNISLGISDQEGPIGSPKSKGYGIAIDLLLQTLVPELKEILL